MRILHVTPYFAPAWAYGGPPRVIYELSRELARKGHTITVLTTDALGPDGRAKPLHENLENVQVVRTPNLSNTLAWRYHLFLPSGLGSFLRSHAQDYDVIHLHMFRTTQNILVNRFSLKNGIPYVFSAHGSLPRIVRRMAAKMLFDNSVGRQILRGAARSIALSDLERRDYEFVGVPRWKISVIPNGVDASIHDSLPPRGGFLRQSGIEGKRLVTYLGRLNARKGLDDLLRAFEDTSRRFEDAILVVAGPDDGNRDRLIRLAERLSISGRVLFPGFLTHTTKLQLLVDSSIVVYPSSNEPFGLVPFEALMCGTPVVVPSESGCGELIQRVGAGITFSLGDHESLGRALSIGLAGDGGINEMVHRGQDLVRNELSWPRIAIQIERVYEEVTHAARRNN